MGERIKNSYSAEYSGDYVACNFCRTLRPSSCLNENGICKESIFCNEAEKEFIKEPDGSKDAKSSDT